jgi:ribosome-associated toxin RatA of RatAB toxin-antitoxin module
VTRRPWRTAGSVELLVSAPPEAVYDLVSDVTRIGERSVECHAA